MTRKKAPARDLASVDELAAEVVAIEEVFTDLSAAVERAKQKVADLPDRWDAAGAGTEGLDRAVEAMAAEIAGIKLPPLESFASVRGEIANARTLGEAAGAVQAHGDTEAFRSDAAATQPGTALPARDQIRAAYARISERTGLPWIGLVDLRKDLPGLPRADVDQALRELSREPGVHLQGEANQQALRPEDRDAAVTFGGSTRHILKIETTRRHRRATA